jgi:hypothetical protein
MVGLWDWIRLVRAVVREKGNLGMFQFHHNPHPKTSLHPSQTNLVKSLVRNQVKSLTPSLSPNQSFSIVSFVGRMVTRESFAIRERERREWLRSGRTRTGTTFLMVCLSLICHCLRERALCVRIRHGDMRNPVAAVVVSLLGIPPLEFTTGTGGIVALRRRGGTVDRLSSMVLVLLQAARGGYLGVVTEVVFVVVVMVGKMV